jgi:hypothetical protein
MIRVNYAWQSRKQKDRLLYIISFSQERFVITYLAAMRPSVPYLFFYLSTGRRFIVDGELNGLI